MVGVGLSTGTQVAALEQEAIGTHVVGIATDAALRVEPGDNLVQEIGGFLGARAGGHGAAEGELRHPGFLEVVLGRELLGLLDEGLEFVGRGAVPVHGEHAHAAVGAGVEELAHPAETLVVAAAVGHGGRDQLGLAAVGRDVGRVGRGGFGRGHGGLGAGVGLVEAQDVAGAAGAAEHGLDGGEPVAEHLAAPEHGHELDAGGQAAGGDHVPVVGPGDGAVAAEGLDGRGVVVGGTTLAGGALRDVHMGVLVAVGDGHGGGGEEAGGDELGEGDHCDGTFFLLYFLKLCANKRRPVL